MKIHLHGFLRNKYAKTVEVQGQNVFQVMRGLVHRFGKGFQKDVLDHNWVIRLGSKQNGTDLHENEINQTLNANELHLIPATSGNDATIRIITGVALFTFGAMTGQNWAMSIGAALVIGGAVELMNRPPNKGPEQDPSESGSYVYNGVVNVTTQGGPIPLTYGHMPYASSVVISTDFSNDERT